MMMPANFSVIAENEMTYVCGGAIADWLPDAPSMKTLTSNIVNIVANGFVGKLVGATLGTLFNGGYSFGKVTSALGAAFFPNGQDWLNSALAVVGGAAAVYQLATVNVSKVVGNKTFLPLA